MKSLNAKTRRLLVRFHDGKLTLEQLEAELLAINPHDENEMEHGFYAEFIDDNIQQYRRGDTYVLSLTSSGSILDN